MRAGNIHATAVLLGDCGVLIQGDSGSGKSTLALALVAEFVCAGRFARLVADDQVMVEAARGRLVARAPGSIAGLAEIHGLGPRAMDHEGAAVIDLVVRLVEKPSAPRFQENQRVVVGGLSLAALDLEARNVAASATAILAWLRLPPASAEG
jgi:serine kinase of HPr protein (carbohydrate metabolism regulator)